MIISLRKNGEHITETRKTYSVIRCARRREVVHILYQIGHRVQYLVAFDLLPQVGVVASSISLRYMYCGMRGEGQRDER